MSAADDYPRLAYVARTRPNGNAAKALNELDALRGDVSKLLSMLADAGVEWPVALPDERTAQ